jgi:hypothetical protein
MEPPLGIPLALPVPHHPLSWIVPKTTTPNTCTATEVEKCEEDSKKSPQCGMQEGGNSVTERLPCHVQHMPEESGDPPKANLSTFLMEQFGRNVREKKVIDAAWREPKPTSSATSNEFGSSTNACHAVPM